MVYGYRQTGCCYLTMSQCWWLPVVLLYINLNLMEKMLCHALDEDETKESRCSTRYAFFQLDVLNTDWIPIESSLCSLKAARPTKHAVENLPDSNCTDLNAVCEQFNMNLLNITDETDRTSMENMSHAFSNQSHSLVYFDEDICKQRVYTKEDMKTFQPQPVNLLICENITQDFKFQTEATSSSSLDRFGLFKPLALRRFDTSFRQINMKAQKNSTSELENSPKSAILMYVCYALTGVAIVSAILTLSVCCVRHHKRRNRTLDNSNYDAEFNLTVEQDTPRPPQTEGLLTATDSDHVQPEPLSTSNKRKLEFNNAIYNTSGLIAKVIIQQENKQDSNDTPKYSGPGQGSRNLHQQNGDCRKGAEQPIAKSYKDIDKIGTATFPSGEYQDFAVELKSKVRRVLSNPTYVHGDDVIRSPIHANPVTTKSVSSDNLRCVHANEPVAKSKEDKYARKNHKERPGPCQSDTEQTTCLEEIRIQKSPEERTNVSRFGDSSKHQITQPRDMSYMYVQLPKEWSKNIPIEEPTVPYASTDITKTIFRHASSKSKHNGQGLIDDDGVYETYDRRT